MALTGTGTDRQASTLRAMNGNHFDFSARGTGSLLFQTHKSSVPDTVGSSLEIILSGTFIGYYEIIPKGAAFKAAPISSASADHQHVSEYASAGEALHKKYSPVCNSNQKHRNSAEGLIPLRTQDTQ